MYLLFWELTLINVDIALSMEQRGELLEILNNIDLLFKLAVIYHPVTDFTMTTGYKNNLHEALKQQLPVLRLAPEHTGHSPTLLIFQEEVKR